MPNISSFKSKEEYTEWYRRYRDKNRDRIREYNKYYNKLWRHDNGYSKDNVRRKVFIAVKKGVIKRENCKVCGKTGAEGHHSDYNKPLQVIWLCPIHHKDMHIKKK